MIIIYYLYVFALLNSGKRRKHCTWDNCQAIALNCAVNLKRKPFFSFHLKLKSKNRPLLKKYLSYVFTLVSFLDYSNGKSVYKVVSMQFTENRVAKNNNDSDST